MNKSRRFHILFGDSKLAIPKDKHEALFGSAFGSSGVPIEIVTVSGSIVSITDALAKPFVSLTAAINPIQDLHGYGKPWPAGGGSNLLPFEDVLTDGWTNTLNGITATYSKGYMKVTGTNTSSGWTNIVTFNSEWALSPINIGVGSFTQSDGLVTRVQIDGSATTNEAGTFTATSSCVAIGFYIAVRGGLTVDWNIPMMLVKGSTRPTTYAPYSNICPISGRESVEVYTTGVNVWDEEWEVGTIAGGGNSPSTVTLRSKNYISVVADTDYYMFFGASDSYEKYIFYYDEDMNYLSYVAKTASAIIHTPQNCHYVRFAYSYYIQAYTTYNNDISINYPSTDTEYHAYSGTTHTIPLGQTVYGGEVDVTEGVLTDGMGMVDLGTLSWIYRENLGGMSAALSPTAKDQFNAVCSAYSYGGAYSQLSDKQCGYVYNNHVFVKDSDYTDAASFKAAVSGVQLCYELATPTTHTITPTPITALHGNNTIWSDAGNVTVEYKRKKVTT